ncbi:hypothetical protein D3C75_1272890 [compost metagenome]
MHVVQTQKSCRPPHKEGMTAAVILNSLHSNDKHSNIGTLVDHSKNGNSRNVNVKLVRAEAAYPHQPSDQNDSLWFANTFR